MRYVIAILIVGVLVGMTSMVADHRAKLLAERMRQRFVDAQAAGLIPSNVDPKDANFNDFGTELSSEEVLQINLLDLWYGYRVILITVLTVTSLAVAHLLPRPDSAVPVTESQFQNK